MLFEASSAVTFRLKETPVVAFVGTLTEKWVATADTVIEFDVPVIEAVVVSVAVIV